MIKQEIVTTMDYDDLNKLLSELFGQRYDDVVADMEWNNYSSYEFDIDAKMSDFEKKYWPDQIELSIAEKQVVGYSLRPLLHRLAMTGKLPFGRIIIKVSW